MPGLLLTVPYTGVQFVALQHAKDTAAKLGLTCGCQIVSLTMVPGIIPVCIYLIIRT